MSPPSSSYRRRDYKRQDLNTTHPGAEQGINPRREHADESYGHFKQACVIEVFDYSSENVVHRLLNNVEFCKMVKEPLDKPSTEMPASKSAMSLSPSNSSDSAHSSAPKVCWINIGGLDWDVIRAVGLKYNLHALALEDVLHEQGHNQSKADYYHEHLFIRILSHILERDGPSDENGDLNVSADAADRASEYPEAFTPSLMEIGEIPPKTDAPQVIDRIASSNSVSVPMEEVKTSPAGNGFRQVKRTFSALSGLLTPSRKKQLMRIRELTKGDRVNVRHEPLFIFLLPTDTVISIHPRPDLEFTAPIAEKLLHSESVLRTSGDASLLVEGLLDLVVDRVLEIMDEYQDKIHQVEHDVLLKPSLSTMRSLHILSGDLIMHKRTLQPIQTMINGLRLYDLQRSVALADNSEAEGRRYASLPPVQRLYPDRHTDSLAVGNHASRKVHGYFSYKATLYMADVNDHMDFVLSSLDMFADQAENLINFAFNTASYEMNQVMRRLTLATIIFLPLTLLTGYFGMNFDSFGALGGSVTLFWAIALPVMGALIPVFMISDLQRLFRYMQKRMATR